MKRCSMCLCVFLTLSSIGPLVGQDLPALRRSTPAADETSPSFRDTTRPQFGVLGGVVSSTVVGLPSGATGLKRLRGFTAGVSLTKTLASHLSMAPEVLYITKGAKNDEVTNSVQIGTAYMEVPLLLRWTFNSASAQKTFLIAGPSVAVKVRCRVDKTVGQQNTTVDCKDDPINDIESTDAGVVVGAGVTDGRISFSVRYDMGLRQINKGEASELSTKNRAFLGIVSVRFGR